jgi:hypothetical protein
VGLGVARGRPGPPRVRGRGQPLCERPAPRHRHRAWQRDPRSSADCGRGELRGLGSHARSDRDDHDRGRTQSVAHASGNAPRQTRRPRRRRRRPRRGGVVGRARARRAVRPLRGSRRSVRDVRRSTVLASVAGDPHPSPGARGAARTGSGSRAGSRATTAGAAGAAADARARPGTGSGTGTGTLAGSGPVSGPVSGTSSRASSDCRPIAGADAFTLSGSHSGSGDDAADRPGASRRWCACLQGKHGSWQPSGVERRRKPAGPAGAERRWRRAGESQLGRFRQLACGWCRAPSRRRPPHRARAGAAWRRRSGGARDEPACSCRRVRRRRSRAAAARPRRPPRGRNRRESRARSADGPERGAPYH